MTRLSTASIGQLPDAVATPAYERSDDCGVVHLGTGAFHRAHQAVYFDELLTRGERGWMIQGSSLRSPAVAEQMNPQDGLFVTAIRDSEGETHRVIGAIRDVIVAPDDPRRLVAALADPGVALVTLTVTEKGYCLDPSTGTLKLNDAGIAADIADIDTPQTAPGFIVAGLKARRDANITPFTVLSCDNLPDNGKRTRSAVLALAREVDAALADWIENEVAFPSSMVDRIVPATTPNDIEAFAAASGVTDEALVKTEPFSQWVVEDLFCNRRPPLEAVGVQMTDDVAGWEKAKLRLLNGAHSALAYLGGLAGHEFVHQAMAAPGFAPFIETLWNEAEATLKPLDGFDPAAYRTELVARFLNSALHHRTHQIAMDGSQKLPQRWMGTVRDYRSERNEPLKALPLALAGWIRWQDGEDDNGSRFEVDDPLADRIQAVLAAAGGNSDDRVKAVLGMSEIFDPDISRDREFFQVVTRHYESLRTGSAAAAIAGFAATEPAGS